MKPLSEVDQSLYKSGVMAGLALPDRDHLKAYAAQVSLDALIPHSVRRELNQPLLPIVDRHRSSLAVMMMPEAPMNLHDPTLGAVGEVRFPRQVTDISPVGLAQFTKNLCDALFRRRSHLSDLRHCRRGAGVQRLHEPEYSRPVARSDRNLS